MSDDVSLRAEPERAAPKKVASAIRRLRQFLPTGLYARSLLIIIIPMVILQTVLAWVFMERHWQMVTNRLSAAVTRDISALIDLTSTYKSGGDTGEIIRIARDRLDLAVSIDPPGPLPPPTTAPLFSILDSTLADQITKQINRPFWLDTDANGRVEIRIQLPDKNLRVVVRRNQTYASNTWIFLTWMVGTALVLVGISILFLRGQIRPILALAKAAERFGKGQRFSEPYQPRGAEEVRRAGIAFLQMRERIERQMEQRTTMLNGVSHDLRTILTRFKLQLAVAQDASDLESLNQDVKDMQAMLEGYLDFAKGETDENIGTLDLAGLLERLKSEARMINKNLTVNVSAAQKISVRPNAFTRLVTNLVANAWRHADNISVEARESARWLVNNIDDDGPGIPEQSREDVFKPFFRLDEARNLDASGTGLGLAIARDIARSHGGNVTLADSPMGGLRATIRIPV